MSDVVTPTLYQPHAELMSAARISGMAAYQELVAQAQADYPAYWGQLAREFLTWHVPPTKNLNASNAPFYCWFEDGLINASYNCLDRHVQQGQGERTALIFESDDGVVTHTSYAQLLARTCQIALALRQLGVQKGDRVMIYMAMSVEGVACMHACARIGAIHSVVFGGFSAQSLRDRIEDTGAVAVITANEQVRGGKHLPLKAVVDEALAMGGCDTVRHVLVAQRTHTAVPMQIGRDVLMQAAVDSQPTYCEPEWVEAEHPLFLLYTSGSTGKPKGVQHATGGYLLHAALTSAWTFDLRPQTDVFWCTADIGWITGHTYVAYGPLALGCTELIFEGVPTYPDASRFWQLIQRHRVTVFYTAPTAIRSLIKASEMNELVHPQRFDLSSLRLLGSVGEPINPAAWEWYYQHVGAKRCPIVDTFWQTETGGHMITPLPGVTALVPGSCTLPFPGIDAAVVDESGQELPHGCGGMLVIRQPWPSMIRSIWGDAERFKKSYFPAELNGYYLAGDGAVRDPQTGYFTITGRIDDVLNVSGHRLGTMEIESALVSCTQWVAEAAVVGRPDETTGEAICAFVVLKQPRPEGAQAQQIAEQLRQWVAKAIGPIAKPRDIRFGDNLPKTRSGKIMRRLLRSIAKGETITQDISTLENPLILEQFLSQ
jgi:acetyl-CoA synthetase